jgi:hypothetical protein
VILIVSEPKKNRPDNGSLCKKESRKRVVCSVNFIFFPFLSLMPRGLSEPVLCKQGKIKEIDNSIPIRISIQLLTSIQPQR